MVYEEEKLLYLWHNSTTIIFDDVESYNKIHMHWEEEEQHRRTEKELKSAKDAQWRAKL